MRTTATVLLSAGIAGSVACSQPNADATTLRNDLPVTSSPTVMATHAPAEVALIIDDSSTRIREVSANAPVMLIDHGKRIVVGAGHGTLVQLEGAGWQTVGSGASVLSSTMPVQTLQALTDTTLLASDEGNQHISTIYTSDMKARPLAVPVSVRAGQRAVIDVHAIAKDSFLFEVVAPTLVRGRANFAAVVVALLADDQGRVLKDSVLLYPPMSTIQFRAGRELHAISDPFYRGPIVRAGPEGMVTAWSSKPIVQWRKQDAKLERVDTLELPRRRISDEDIRQVATQFPNAKVRAQYANQLRTAAPEYWPAIQDLRRSSARLWVRVGGPPDANEEWWVFRPGAKKASRRIVLAKGEHLRAILGDTLVLLCERKGGAVVKRVQVRTADLT